MRAVPACPRTPCLLKSRPSWRRVWVLIALAVVLAQTLGQLHRVAHLPHAPGQAMPHVAGHGHHRPFALPPGHSPCHWLERLFAEDEAAGSCVLFDQLAHADGLTGTPPAWQVVLQPVTALSTAQTRPWVAEPAAQRARGPPPAA